MKVFLQEKLDFESDEITVEITSKLAKKIPNTEKKIQDFLTSRKEKMQFEELNFDEFEEAFKSLKRNKAAGFDDLSSNIIIDAYDSLKNMLFHVFKVSIQQEIFPDSLQIAIVTPIFKSGDKDNAIMYNRVYNHLDSEGLLYEKQFGFQRNNSTEHAIFQLTRDITGSFEKGEYTFGGFIDLSKTFDTRLSDFN